MQLDIYYSYACRESYLVFEWLNRVKENGYPLNINWHPFAIQIDAPNHYWNRTWDTANSELRGFIAAESAKQQGREYFSLFHKYLEMAVHEQFLELGDEATLMNVAQKAKLDLSRFQSDVYNSQLIKNIHNSHLLGIKKWNIFGTPTLIFENGHSFHLELNEIPLVIDALKTFQAVEVLVNKQIYIKQLKKTN
ncbi:MAG: DsbA family protein [Anaerolineales bacterium]|nr:DsbA family protein [Anaerolineales bacterium]MBX3035781.1 DsbA family protein [Anaerolineales bacterium]